MVYVVIVFLIHNIMYNVKIMQGLVNKKMNEERLLATPSIMLKFISPSSSYVSQTHVMPSQTMGCSL